MNKMALSSSSSVTDQSDAAGERGQSFYSRGGPVAPLGDGKTTNNKFYMQTKKTGTEINRLKNRNVMSSHEAGVCSSFLNIPQQKGLGWFLFVTFTISQSSNS